MILVALFAMSCGNDNDQRGGEQGSRDYPSNRDRDVQVVDHGSPVDMEGTNNPSAQQMEAENQVQTQGEVDGKYAGEKEKLNNSWSDQDRLKNSAGQDMTNQTGQGMVNDTNRSHHK